MDDWRETWHGLHEVLGGKWAFHVLRALSEEPRGFNALSRDLGVRSKTLSKRLTELRCRGFLDREVHPTTPPTTTYRLTPKGEAFVSHLRAMEQLVEPCDCAESCVVLPGELPAEC
jgi:DNA-binding HxlR family transcriptional regulator